MYSAASRILALESLYIVRKCPVLQILLTATLTLYFEKTFFRNFDEGTFILQFISIIHKFSPVIF